MSQNGAFRWIGGKEYRLAPRDYAVTIAHGGVAGTPTTGFINIDPSSSFLLMDRNMFDTLDPTVAAPGSAGQYENFIQVVDNNSNYTWSNIPVNRSAFARTRDEGYRLPCEVIIAANTRLSLTITEPAAGAGVGNTTVTLQGYSLYPTGN